MVTRSHARSIYRVAPAALAAVAASGSGRAAFSLRLVARSHARSIYRVSDLGGVSVDPAAVAAIQERSVAPAAAVAAIQERYRGLEAAVAASGSVARPVTGARGVAEAGSVSVAAICCVDRSRCPFASARTCPDPGTETLL